MGSDEHRFVCLDQDPQENRDCKARDVGGVLQRTNYVSLSLPPPSLQTLTVRYRNSILSFHSAMTGLTRQGTRASVDEKTPLAKGVSRSSSSASSEVIVRRHERWGKH